jgi:hypothetical protein
MKLIDVEFMIDGSKIVFYFSADGRVDFRELAKDLAGHFKNRIELRQIGVRDEARILGGIGICGRPLCCSKWLSDFHPVSIKMAKQQNLSLNPSKISGTCGRLMCCLNFEDKTYKELRKGMPKDNERVDTPDGLAKVVNVDYFNGKINTRAIEKDPETGGEVFSQEIHSFRKEEIRRIGKNAGKERADDLQRIAGQCPLLTFHLFTAPFSVCTAIIGPFSLSVKDKKSRRYRIQHASRFRVCLSCDSPKASAPHRKRCSDPHR